MKLFSFPVIWAIAFGVASIWVPIPLWVTFLPMILLSAFLFCLGAIAFGAVMAKASKDTKRAAAETLTATFR